MIMALFGVSDLQSASAILVLYFISILIALSPVGEAILAFVSGARRMSRADMKNRLVPMVTKIHNRAIAKTPGMTKIIHLKVMYDSNPNAFALGRRTICVTEGLLSLPDEMIEGIIAHEVGHLACHHTVLQLLIGGGNFIITSILAIFRTIGIIFTAIGTLLGLSRDDSKRGCGCALSIVGIISSVAVWLWTKFCMLFLMWSSRANEFAADKYALEIGFGNELAAALDRIGAGTPQSSFLKAIYSTHPNIHDRIGKLQEMGVTYSRY